MELNGCFGIQTHGAHRVNCVINGPAGSNAICRRVVFPETVVLWLVVVSGCTNINVIRASPSADIQTFANTRFACIRSST